MYLVSPLAIHYNYPRPHLHFLVTFSFMALQNIYLLFSLFRRRASSTSFTFPRHFSLIAQQNFVIFVIFAFFCSFRNFRCFVEGLPRPHLHFLVLFSLMAQQNFVIFVIFAFFVVFVIFAVSSRAFLNVICISLSLFVHGLAKFRNISYFRCFVEGV